jgi:MSHA biogenesis protein MshQ
MNRLVVALLLLLLIPGVSYSATYTLPGDAASLAGTCSAGGNVVNCSGHLNFGNNDTIVISQPLTLNISGNLQFGNGFSVNAAGNANDMQITVAGDVLMSNNATINASLTVSGSITAANNGDLEGNLTVTGTLSLGNNSSVSGNISAGTVEIAQNVSVTGNIEADNVYINGGNSTIDGNITATDTVVNNGTVTGDISAPHITNNGMVGGSTSCDTSDGSNPADCDSVAATQMQWLAFEQPDWLLDISGQGNHASGTGSAEPLLLTSQISCSATSIPDNSSESIQDAVDTQLDVNDIGDKGTISFWYRSNENWQQVDSNKMLFDASAGSNAQFALWLDDEGGISFRLSESDGDTQLIVSQSLYSFTSSDWVHIAFAWDMTDDTIRLFINGNQQNLLNMGSVVAFDEGLPQLSTLYIGDNRSSTVSASGNSADGLIDEWRVYNFVQSNAQINADIANTSDCPAPDLQCDNYTFQSSDDFASNWQVSTSSGSFIPATVNGRVRLTEAINNQSTRITLNKKFPAAGNRVEIEFDYYAYNGDSADGIAIVLSDASITPQSGSFGGSLGYAQRNNGDAGFAGGWLGIGLDEYGNFSNETEGREGGIGFRPDSVALRGAAQHDYPFLKAATGLSPALDVPGATPGPGHRYRIVVDSQIAGTSFISISRDTGSGFVELIAPFDVFAEFPDQQPVVPEDFLLSFTGSTGGSVNIHEIDNLEVCAIEAEDIFVGPHHYRLQHNQTGYLCGASEVIVKACANESCDELYNNETSLSLTSSEGSSWSAQNLVFTGSSVTGLSADETGDFTIGVLNTEPEAPVYCYSAGTGSDCQINFVEVGLELSWAAAAPQADIPSQLSQQAFAEELYVGLAQADTCEADLEGQELELALKCVDPASCNNNMLLVNGSVTGNPADYISTGVTFNDQGIAVIPQEWLRYDDAGLVQLEVRNSQQNAFGLSNTFVVKPTQLLLSANNSNPHIAGADFNLNVQAVGENGQVTPNYQPGDFQMQFERAAPAAGVEGVLVFDTDQLTSETPADFVSIDHSALDFNAGISATSPYITEVGEFSLALRDVDYFDHSISSQSLSLGRFIPAYFQVTAEEPELLDTCTDVTPFSYVGDAIGFDESNELQPAIRIEARNMQDQITENYADTFWRLASWDIPAQISYSDNSYEPDNTLSANLDQQQLTQLEVESYDGVGFYRIDNATVTYEKGVTSLAPFDPSLAITISEAALTDSDGVCFRNSATDPCQPFTISDIGGAKLRYGRARLTNAYGQETEDLPVPLQLEYYDGSSWVLNSDDNCSAYNAGDLQLTTTLTTSASGAGVVTGGRPLVPMQGFVLEAAGETGEVELLWQNLPQWLQFDWQGDGTDLSNPTAVATFGQYRGNDRIIHWREVFE